MPPDSSRLPAHRAWVAAALPSTTTIRACYRWLTLVPPGPLCLLEVPFYWGPPAWKFQVLPEVSSLATLLCPSSPGSCDLALSVRCYQNFW